MPHPKQLLLICMLLAAGTLFAGSGAANRRSRNRLAPLEEYNIRAGNLSLDFAYKSELSMDTNTNRSTLSSARNDGVAWENGINTKLHWPISRLLEFQTSLYLGYIGYLSGEGTDGIIADAKTSNALELEIRLTENSYLYVMDNITINIDSVYDLAEDNTQDLKMLENDFALQYEGSFSSLYSAALRVGRKDVYALSREYKHRDLVTHYSNLTFGWQMNERLLLQPYANYAQHRYDTPQNNNADEYELGVETRYHLSEFSQLLLGVGYQNIEFDNSHTPIADENARGLTGRIALSSDLTANIRHAISARHGRRLGTSRFINYVTDYLAAYSIDWRMAQQWKLQSRLSWLRAREESRLFGETYQFYVGSTELTYELSRTIELYTGYQYSEKDSNLTGGDFSRHRIWLGMNWDF